MATAEELAAAEAAAKATAAAYNSQNPAGETEEEAAARAAANELNAVQGSVDHNGSPAVRADTPEELAAREAKKAEEEAAAAEAALTDEEKEAKAAEEAAAKAAEREEAAKNEEGEWMQTSSKDFNAAIAMMKKAGMTPAEAALVFDKAANTGNINDVDMELLVEKVGKEEADLITGGFAKFVETEGQAALQRTKAIQDAVGGTENWTEMVRWARATAKGDEAFTAKVKDLTAMMNGESVLQAELAAKEFQSMYNADEKNSTLAAKAPAPITPLATPAVDTKPTVTPLSARAYAEGLEEATRNLSGAALNAKEAELSRARAAGRKQGL